MSNLFALQSLDTDNVVTLLVAFVGFGGTIAGLLYASRQLAAGQRSAAATARVTQGTFLLQLSDHFRHFDAIHRGLLAEDKPQPWTPPHEDWTSVVQYMGLFERCHILIQCEALDLATFERLYGYRFRLLVDEAIVRQHYLSAEHAAGWQDFIALWADLDAAQQARTGEAPRYQAPIELLQPPDQPPVEA